MCGIAGIINIDGFTAGEIVKMTDIISHRGPDDEGFVVFTDLTKLPLQLGGKTTPKDVYSSMVPYKPATDITEFKNQKALIAFGHRRLSILDLSPAGHQPMSYANGRYWIVLNGEIYNYIEIRVELMNKGYQFFSNSDTEVILAAYQEWGIDCQHKFNGMWAFAIYDTLKMEIFLSRDRFGIKPLYYWFSPKGDFCFASEIKQYTVLPDWRAILNKERAFDYLYYALTDHTDETLFKGVYMIPPGSYSQTKIQNLSAASGRISFSRWYNPVVKELKINFEEAKAEFLAKFQDAIKLHLRADVPVGSALSGGLDSSSIVSYVNILLKQQGKSELQKTFSSCSHDERFDERNWMEEVVKETQVDGHYIYPKGEDIFLLTDKLIWHMDEPYQSQSAFLGYHVFQEAKRFNVIVLLNGQGADEYLSCYGNFRILRHKRLLKSLKLKNIQAELDSYFKILKICSFVLQDTIPSSYRNKLSFYNSKNRAFDKIVAIEKLVKKKKHPYDVMAYDNSNHINISKHQLFREPLQKYLRWEDRNSMAHSVEARVPFLDYRLVEFVHSLPLDYLDAPSLSKRILVEAMVGILPEKVRNRKDKKGFITPEQRWFTNDFKDDFLKLFDDNIEYSKGLIDKNEAKSYLIKMQKGMIPFDYSYWRIILFCIWMKVFNVELD